MSEHDDGDYDVLNTRSYTDTPDWDKERYPGEWDSATEAARRAVYTSLMSHPGLFTIARAREIAYAHKPLTDSELQQMGAGYASARASRSLDDTRDADPYTEQLIGEAHDDHFRILDQQQREGEMLKFMIDHPNVHWGRPS